MGAFGKILCAVDLGDATELVLRLGDREARLHGATLSVIHVLPTQSGAPMSPEGVEASMMAREELASDVIDSVLTRVQAITGRTADEVDVSIEDGPPEVALPRKVEELDADLVVLGSGPHAARLVRALPTSVLVARVGGTGGGVLLATDLEALSEPACALAAAEARSRGTNLLLAHSLEVVGGELTIGDPAALPAAATPTAFPVVPVDDMRASVRQRLDRTLAEAGVPGEVMVTEGPAAHAVVKLAEERGAELVVVGTAGRSGLDRLLLGSVAESIVKEAPCPVLVVRPPHVHRRAASASSETAFPPVL